MKRNRFIAIYLSGVLLLSSCAQTVKPDPVFSTAPSYSEKGLRNSGIISFDGTGAFFDSHARDRYNSLIDSYGELFDPALQHDTGITPQPDGTYHIDNLYLERAVQMNQWRKSGKSPVKKEKEGFLKALF